MLYPCNPDAFNQSGQIFRTLSHHHSVLIHFYTEAAGENSVPGGDSGVWSPTKNPREGETTPHGFDNNMEDNLDGDSAGTHISRIPQSAAVR